MAIVTGAGGGLGKQYAIELARRGCNVVVNDLGGNLSGGQHGEIAAKKVVDEIAAFGGKAVAEYSNVLDAKAIVAKGMESFGRVDIVINNAGILRDKSFHKMTEEDWQNVLDVHLLGTFRLCHEVWPLMQQKSYGRIVNVTSGAGLYGNFGQANYAAAKMGILGLTQTLAKEGEKSNIKVNCIAPVAASRMTETVLPKNVLDMLDPAYVLPMVTYLAGESCKCNGAAFELGGGWYSQVRWQRSAGIVLKDENRQSSAEDIAENIDKICDFGGSPTYPTSPSDALQYMIAPASTVKSSKVEKKQLTGGSVVSDIKFQSDKIISESGKKILSNNDIVTKLVGVVNASVRIDVTLKDGSIARRWMFDFSSTGQARVTQLEADERGKVLIICSEDVLLKLIDGSLSAEIAFMTGQIKVKGAMPIAIKFKEVLKLLRS